MLHWDYYIALENDLLACQRYVEFHEANMKVYSVEFVRLLLATCSEIDVLAKSLCCQIDADSKARDIRDYRTTLEPALSFASFSSGESPDTR